MAISAKRVRLRVFTKKIPMADIAARCGTSRAWIEAILNGRYVGPASQEWLVHISRAVEDIIEERKVGK